MKKIISFAAVILLLFSLISCDEKEKNREYNETEVKAAAELLIKESAPLNDVFWGAGIEYEEDFNYKNGFYYPAKTESVEKLGISTLDGLKKKTEAVFSKGYCDSIYKTVFTSYGDEDDLLGYARYYQGIDRIMVYSKANVLLADKVEYHYGTLSVLGSEEKTVFVTISVTVTRGEKSQTQIIKVGLLEEESGWRIDTPTYLVYNEFLDD